MRKQIFQTEPRQADQPALSELDVASMATVLVTSEADGHPVEHTFDNQRGPGGTCWRAATDGDQTLILAFDQPQSIREVALEVEETGLSRTQELTLAVSTDGGQNYRELLRQEFNFSPPQTTFERETWQTKVDGITHLRLWVKPDKGNRPCRATVTSLSVRYQGH